MNYFESISSGFESFNEAIKNRTQIMNEIHEFSLAIEKYTNSKFQISIGMRLEIHFDKRYKGVSRAAAIANSLLGDEVEKYQKSYLALYCEGVEESEILSEISISDEGFPIVIAAFGMQSMVTDMKEFQQSLNSFTQKFEFIDGIKRLVDKKKQQIESQEKST